MIHRLAPLDVLAGLLYWQLTFFGGCLIAEGVVGPSAIYDTFRVVMPVAVWGSLSVGIGHFVLLAHLRQRRLAKTSPISIKRGRFLPLTRALWFAGVASFAFFVAIGAAYLVHFDWTLTTAQAMYWPAAVASLFLASEGQSPWS